MIASMGTTTMEEEDYVILTMEVLATPIRGLFLLLATPAMAINAMVG